MACPGRAVLGRIAVRSSDGACAVRLGAVVEHCRAIMVVLSATATHVAGAIDRCRYR
jgi:hypothetical protein